jgi:hypothetical protein
MKRKVDITISLVYETGMSDDHLHFALQQTIIGYLADDCKKQGKFLPPDEAKLTNCFVDYATSPKTGEVNCTAMAESCACEFDLYEDKVEWVIPEVVFDWAVDVDDSQTKSAKGRTGRTV